jgi:hypothetical protein
MGASDAMACEIGSCALAVAVHQAVRPGMSDRSSLSVLTSHLASLDVSMTTWVLMCPADGQAHRCAKGFSYSLALSFIAHASARSLAVAHERQTGARAYAFGSIP